MSPGTRCGRGSPRPSPARGSGTSPPPSAPSGVPEATGSAPISAATASAGPCTRSRRCPTRAPPAAAACSSPAWSSPSSRGSWPAAGTCTGSTGTAGRSGAATAAGRRTPSTRWPSPRTARWSSPSFSTERPGRVPQRRPAPYLTQPLIRYELTDRFTPAGTSGGGALFASVEGRSDDVFRYAEASVHPFVIGAPLLHAPAVREFQIRQTERGADIAAVTEAGFDPSAIVAAIGRSLRQAGLTRPQVGFRRVGALDRDPMTSKARRFIPLSVRIP